MSTARFVDESWKRAQADNASLPSRQFDESTFPVKKLPVPQQEGGYDCGVHLLRNVESFLLLTGQLLEIARKPCLSQFLL
jgi:hypothetical protein